MSRFQSGSKIPDWENEARAILKGEIAIEQSDIPELLEWLEDMHWLGSQEIVEFLCSYRGDLVEPIRRIFGSRDMIWIGNILLSLGRRFPSIFWLQLKKEISAVAKTIDGEFANIYALRILAQHKLMHEEEIRRLLVRFCIEDPENCDDYDEIELILDTR